MSELLPCPFCGWSDPSWHVEHYAYDLKEYAVHCGNCDAESAMLKTREEAATSWNRRTPQPSEQLREALAEYAHEAWSGWMKYLFSKCEPSKRPTFAGDHTIPSWAVERWQRQMKTKFSALPEEEKQSDYDEADKMLAIMGRWWGPVEPPQATE